MQTRMEIQDLQGNPLPPTIRWKGILGAASSWRTRRTQPSDKGAGFGLFQSKSSSEATCWLGLPCHMLQREKGFPAGNRYCRSG